MSFGSLILMGLLGLVWAELYHRCRLRVLRYYPDFELENERRLREEYYDYPQLLVGRFNSETQAVMDFVFTPANRHALPAHEHWPFLALYGVTVAMVGDLAFMVLWTWIL